MRPTSSGLVHTDLLHFFQQPFSFLSSLLVLSAALLLGLTLNLPPAHPEVAAVFSQLYLLTTSFPKFGPLGLKVVDMPSSKLRKSPYAPPTFNTTPTCVLEDASRLIEQSRKVQNWVISNVQPETATFAKVLLPLAHVRNARSREANILCFYQSVSTNQELRDASSEAENLLTKFDIESYTREDLFILIDAVLKRNEVLDPESRLLLEKEHRDFIRNGLGLPSGPLRDRFKAIQKRLNQLSIEFRKNLNEENGGIWFNPEELDGVPEDIMSQLKRGSEGSNMDKLRLTFKYPDYFPTIKYAKNAETRKRVYTSNDNKCNQNVPLLKEALILRDEAARLLGYPNHAAFRLEDKMIKSPESINNFLESLRLRLSAKGLEEVEKLKEYKHTDLNTRGEQEELDGNYYLWDHKFYDRLMLEREFSFDQQKVAEYFPLNTTILGMLKIFEDLFGLEFVEITGDKSVWHEDVQLLSVWDDEAQGSNFLGYLYLDLYPRTGKFGHAANFNLQQVCTLTVAYEMMLTRTGVYPPTRKPTIPGNSIGLQLLQTFSSKAQSLKTR
jgi:metallopeptidase MepB